MKRFCESDAVFYNMKKEPNLENALKNLDKHLRKSAQEAANKDVREKLKKDVEASN